MKYLLSIFILVLSFSFIGIDISHADHNLIPETDTGAASLYSFIDLRDRETYVQVTNTANPDVSNNIDVSGDVTVHVQIFNVDDNCNENNFFDTLTPNDTHVYNMRDIQTNNGAPSGVILPDNAYGFVVISPVESGDLRIDEDARILIGSVRILDDSGYEYRTNSAGHQNDSSTETRRDEWLFNFNTKGGVTLSDIVAIVVKEIDDFGPTRPAVEASNILEAWHLIEVDIYDTGENAFSCRNVMFACTDQDSPLYEELLEEPGDDDDDSANVASFEYGINNAIPHSKGGELLCPGNTIEEGIVRLHLRSDEGSLAGIFVGLNNGNGRGSMDTAWGHSGWVQPPEQ
jgi:hypothetical protein